ncbi:MAG: HDIG domain-containing protein [Clostridiales bacterium]|nr:HDIG domain-containing protein [Clostridiales bacterium]
MAKRRRKKEALKKEIVSEKPRSGKNNINQAFWWALFMILSMLILSFGAFPRFTLLNAGEIAPDDIFHTGPTNIYESDILTEKAREEAAGNVEQIFNTDPEVTPNLLAQVDNIFTLISQIKNNPLLETEKDRLNALEQAFPGQYSDTAKDAMLDLDDLEITSLRNGFKSILSGIFQAGVRPEEVKISRERAGNSLASLASSEDIEVFLQETLNNLEIKANKTYDAIATFAKGEEVRAAITPVQVTVFNGQKLISKGSLITDEEIEKLNKLGLQGAHSGWLPYLGLLLLIALLYTLLIVYLRLYHPQTRGRDSNIVLIGVLINLTLFLCRLVSLLQISDKPEVANLIGYLLPVAFCSMLISVLLGRGIAIFITLIISVAAGFIGGSYFPFTAVAIVGGIVGVFSTHNVNQRSQFVIASLYIAAANALTIIGMGLFLGTEYPLMGIGVLIGAINGVISAILVLGILPFLEGVFRITTVVRLLELSHSNHPLLKRLMIEAPGTYHHSVLVGNLAEAAADVVDADPLLVRVASYYHDIGKTKRPYFFIENQQEGDNPHDRLQPSLSVLIISSHVKEGVEMLKNAKFPEEIIDIVAQHHGDGRLSFFYRKALEKAENSDSIREKDFRYPGPPPQTKEAALVMLADSVQAAVHSLKNPTQEQIEKKVNDIIKNKIDDNQLQGCNLTFKDIEKISQAFKALLIGMHHKRLDYPDEVAKEMRKLSNDYSFDDTKPAADDSPGEGNGRTLAAPESNSPEGA